MVQINCPSCGTPVQFRSELTLYAACGSCGSLLVRKDVNLEKIGTVGELQPDGTLLKLGTQGSYAGKSFEVLGRMQVALGTPEEPGGFWNEWFIATSDGRSGWIGEAMGSYFVNFERDIKGLPAFHKLKLGATMRLADHDMVVTSLTSVTVAGFEGELPFVSRQNYPLPFADLRTTGKTGATLDYSEGEPLAFVGEWCQFADLKFTNLRQDGEDMDGSTPGASAQTLKCPTCGAPHELRAGAISQSLICGFCDTAIDLNSDATFAKVHKFDQAKAKVPALLPIGSKGTFWDETRVWECIGFLRKSVRVDGILYYWSEYLLYNRNDGYRWLTETNGHWTLLKSLNSVPGDNSDKPIGYPPTSMPIRFQEHTFKHFQNATARTEYAAGEFYWRVRIQDVSSVDDFVAPPYVLSADTSQTEIVWSLGQYYDGAKLWRDFKVPGQPPSRTGVANNQPNGYLQGRDKMWLHYLASVAAAFLMFCYFSAQSGKALFEQNYTYMTYEAERSHAESVELTGRTSNVKISLESTFENRWAIWQLTLINEETHVGYDTGCQVSFYRDEDGTYGSHQNSVMIPSVPAGKYLFRIDPVETGTGDMADPTPKTPPPITTSNQPVFNYTVKLFRDVPVWGLFWPYAFLLLLPPCWVTYKASTFETQRWSESDHAPVSSGGSE